MTVFAKLISGFDTGDVISVVALVVAALGVLVGARATWRATTRALLQQQLTTYLDAYQKALGNGGVPGTVQDFGHLDPVQRRGIEILAGQLVGVIDLMVDVDDPRLPRWREFLAGIPGAIALDEGFRLEDYARHDSTRIRIREVRAAEIVKAKSKNIVRGLQ